MSSKNQAAMDQQQLKIYDMPGGMRLVCRRVPLELEYFGVVVNAGSREDPHALPGLAHFVEHTIFKGTRRRRASHILNRMESVGGELNAFTSKEETNIYSVFPRGSLRRAADLIADLICNSVFPAAEIAKEREVVIDEIQSYLDTPAELVYDDFEDLFFNGSQLGHNILGMPESVERFESSDCLNFLRENFFSSRMVAYYLGPTPSEQVLKTVLRAFEGVRTQGQPLCRVAPLPAGRFSIRKSTDTHQAHTVIGASLPGTNSPMRDTIALVTNILGGPGLNSRLNVALRERRGLVYTVEASTTTFSDCGLFTIYFGCDPSDLDRCISLTYNELHRIATTPMTPRQLSATKRQLLGQLIVGSQNIEQTVLNYGRALLLRDNIRKFSEIRDSIEAITPEDVMQVAGLIAPDKCSLLTLG